MVSRASRMQAPERALSVQPPALSNTMVGGGGWWWMVVDGGGWWWMVVDGGGIPNETYTKSIVSMAVELSDQIRLCKQASVVRVFPCTSAQQGLP